MQEVVLVDKHKEKGGKQKIKMDICGTFSIALQFWMCEQRHKTQKHTNKLHIRIRKK